MDTHRWDYLFHCFFSFVPETYLQCLNRVLGFGRGVYRERRPLEVYPRSTIVEDENTITRSEVIKLPMNDTCFDVCSSVGEQWGCTVIPGAGTYCLRLGSFTFDEPGDYLVFVSTSAVRDCTVRKD